MHKKEGQRTELKGKRFYIHTFGCQMNDNDSERIAGTLQSGGAIQSNSPENCDILIVNTCAVREKSEEKLYSLLGRLKSFKNNKTQMGVVGCVAQLHRSKLINKVPSIDFVVGPDNYNRLLDIIPVKTEGKKVSTQRSSGWHEIPGSLTLRESPVSGYVTIMEGCNNFCSYCVVPFTRGREKFRPQKNILSEIRDLADKGYKEIQLLGQNVNSYNDPETKKSFFSLLLEVDRIDGIEWIRFITSHPKNFDPEIAKAMKDAQKVCRQLHLPVQSGSTSVLQRMNRGYSREEYLKKIDILYDLMPDIALSTDIIVGFPDETEEEFQETLSILKRVQYTNIFSFRYSPRPLTAASELEDSVPFEVKKRRLIELQMLQKELQLKKNEQLIGKTIKTLVTGRSKKDNTVYSGRNEGYQVINFPSEADVFGEFVDVKIKRCGPYSLSGIIVR